MPENETDIIYYGGEGSPAEVTVSPRTRAGKRALLRRQNLNSILAMRKGGPEAVQAMQNYVARNTDAFGRSFFPVLAGAVALPAAIEAGAAIAGAPGIVPAMTEAVTTTARRLTPYIANGTRYVANGLRTAGNEILQSGKIFLNHPLTKFYFSRPVQGLQLAAEVTPVATRWIQSGERPSNKTLGGLALHAATLPLMGPVRDFTEGIDYINGATRAVFSPSTSLGITPYRAANYAVEEVEPMTAEEIIARQNAEIAAEKEAMSHKVSAADIRRSNIDYNAYGTPAGSHIIPGVAQRSSNTTEVLNDSVRGLSGSNGDQFNWWDYSPYNGFRTRPIIDLRTGTEVEEIPLGMHPDDNIVYAIGTQNPQNTKLAAESVDKAVSDFSKKLSSVLESNYKYPKKGGATLSGAQRFTKESVKYESPYIIPQDGLQSPNWTQDQWDKYYGIPNE